MSRRPPSPAGFTDQQLQFEGIAGELMTLALSKPEEALPEIDRFAASLKESVSEQESGQSKGAAVWGPQVLYFLAHGKLAELKEEAMAEPSEVESLCERALTEYRLAYEAALYTDTETYEQTVVVKPAGLFRKEVTAVESRQREVTKSQLDPQLLDEPLDYVAGTLEKIRSRSVQRILGRTKLRYLLGAGRVSISNALRRRMESSASIKENLRSLFDTFIEAPFEIGSAAVISCMDSGNLRVVSCSLYQDLEQFAPDDTQNPFSILLARKTTQQSDWNLSPVEPLDNAGRQPRGSGSE